MLMISDDGLPERVGDLEIVNRIGSRSISCVFHDIDGTHSRIRQWEPIMSRVLHTVIKDGIPAEMDSSQAVEQVSQMVGTEPLPETDRFCVESAGLSAITQMEWAIRRGIEEGTVKVDGTDFDDRSRRINTEVICGIWQGQETHDFEESESIKAFLKVHTPKLFLFYEQVLNHACRNRNLELAATDPESWRIAGSLEFIRALHQHGIKNYFVTGSVVQTDAQGKIAGGIYEEVLTLGFEIGAGQMVEAIFGSRWDQRMPKNEVIRNLCLQLDIDARNLLVIGDGRTEIKIGVDIGAVTISRLAPDADRLRDLHRELGTNYIMVDFLEASVSQLMPALYPNRDS